jgi:hypothetical protein
LKNPVNVPIFIFCNISVLVKFWFGHVIPFPFLSRSRSCPWSPQISKPRKTSRFNEPAQVALAVFLIVGGFTWLEIDSSVTQIASNAASFATDNCHELVIFTSTEDFISRLLLAAHKHDCLESHRRRKLTLCTVFYISQLRSSTH